MDDIIAASSFSNKYKRPISGTDEQVYYYPRTDNSILQTFTDCITPIFTKRLRSRKYRKVVKYRLR